jgi:hypothetical protein
MKEDGRESKHPGEDNIEMDVMEAGCEMCILVEKLNM